MIRKRTINANHEHGDFVYYGTTTDGNALQLALDGGQTGSPGSKFFVLDEDASYGFNISIIARRTDADNESANYHIHVCGDRNTAGNATIVGSVVKEVHSEDTGGWDFGAAFNSAAAQELAVTVTGAGGSTIKWTAHVQYYKVSG